MAVKVYKDKGTAAVENFDKGEQIRVVDAHLMVTTSNPNDPVAIFAPGAWHRAEVA